MFIKGKRLRSIVWMILIALLINVVSVSGIFPPMVSITSALSNNYAIGKTYSASSTYNSTMSRTSMAADADTNTWWRHMSTDSAPWWKVDLGSSLSFNRIVMKEYLRNGDYRIWKYKIEYSTDNSKWTMLDSEGDNGVDNVVIGLEKIVDFSRITARYVKFSILSKDPTDISGLYEFEIYNTAGTPSQVTVTVQNTINGKSPMYVGFSATRMAEGSNQPSWWKYLNANTVRWWISPGRYVPDSAISTDTVSNVTNFNNLKAALRANPEGSNYINWSTVNSRFTFYNDTSGKTLYTTDWALQKYKDLGIEVMAELNSNDWDDTWSNHWHNWKKIYATAFHVAKNYDVHIFQTPNEPDHPNMETLYGNSNRLAQVIKIYSDACRCAIQDVNTLYGKSLQPIIVAPVLAGSSNSEYDTKILQQIRTDYAGNQISYNNVDWYDRHRYSSDPSSFQSQISSIKSTMDNNLPSGVSRLPITFSEWNWSTNGNWETKTETSDSPTVFTDVAETWGLTMQSGAKGMYLFKFSDGATINGNRVQYEYLLPKDPTENKAYNKPVTTSSQQTGYEGSKAVDNDISDTSMWRSSASATAPQTLEIDLQGTYTLKSATIENGTDNGLLENTEVLAQLKLQYWTGTGWSNIPNAVFSGTAGSLMLINFTSPITTSKVRLYTDTAGEVRIREIALSENYIVYDIGGPMKSAETERLFAEGFKGGRNLYTTTISGSSDSSNKAFTSYDPTSNNYYIWLSRRSSIAEPITLNLSALDVSQNSVVTVREVSTRRFGEVVSETSIPTSKSVSLGYQPSESLWLVTIPKGIAYVTTNLNPVADAQVKIGTNINGNFGTATTMTVRQSNTVKDDNSAAYIKFDTGATDLSQVKQAILKVYGTKNAVSPNTPLAVNVYVVNNDTWSEGAITGNNAPNLNKNAAFITDVGNTADIAGILTYINEGEYAAVDVTKYVKEHPNSNITFALVREKRYPGLGEVKDTQYFTLDSKEGTNKPILEIRKIPTPTPTPTPQPLAAIGAITGTVAVGSRLTAGGLTPAGAAGTAKYQWKISATAGGVYSDIVGATSSTYTILPADVTKFIKVSAIGTGSYTGTVTSGATSAVAPQPTFSPIDDALVRDGSYASTNYGQSTILVVKTGASARFNRRSYLKFDLTELDNRNISSVKLRIYGHKATYENGDTLTAYKALNDNNNWSENSITWSNQPGLGSSISSRTIGSTSQYYEFDITSYAKNMISQGKGIAVVLDDASSSNNYFVFNSAEATANKPVLEVTYN